MTNEPTSTRVSFSYPEGFMTPEQVQWTTPIETAWEELYRKFKADVAALVQAHGGPVFIDVRSCQGDSFQLLLLHLNQFVKMTVTVGFDFDFVRSAASCNHRPDGVAAVEVEVGVEVMGDLQAGLFQRGEGAATGQEFGFERAPAGFGLRVIVRIARPAEAGQGARLFDAGATSRTGVLAAAVGVDDGWRSVRACSSAWSTSSVGIWAARCQPTTRLEQASRS